jgi:hypothetical protein
MSRKAPLTVVIAILALAALSYAGWRFVHNKSQENCQVCRRAAHVPTRTLGTEAGHEAVFCCPTCARSQARQSKGDVRVMELTDYHTLRPLGPDSAFLVENSDVNPCLDSHQAHLDEHKQPLMAHFDRCTPSVIAFSSRDAAVAFAKEHGGRVLTFANWWRE